MTVVDEAKQTVHEALGGLVDEGEMVVGWHVTLEVIGPDDAHYLAHRAGTGIDGNEYPQVWTVVGWLEAASMSARDQLRDCTIDFDECDEEEEDDG